MNCMYALYIFFNIFLRGILLCFKTVSKYAGEITKQLEYLNLFSVVFFALNEKIGNFIIPNK